MSIMQDPHADCGSGNAGHLDLERVQQAQVHRHCRWKHNVNSHDLDERNQNSWVERYSSIVGVLRVTLLVALALGGCSGGKPAASKSPNGSRLEPCPASPNCVSSLASAESQRVEALRYSGEVAQAKSRLLTVLRSVERVHIVRVEETYIHAEFRSALLGFVDDVEFLFDRPGAIQIRSASRLGYSDFGVNRERVAAIRARFSGSVEADS